MQLLASPNEREQLEAIDRAIEHWMQILRAEADKVDREHASQFIHTAQKLALRLDEELPPSLDVHAKSEIRGILIDALRKIEEIGEDRPLDILDDFLVRAEAIRHVVRDALDEDLPVDPRDRQAVVEVLLSALPGIPRKNVAQLVGVSDRTMARWQEAPGPATRRLCLVTKLVLVLKNAWTPEGVLAWFKRPRPGLDGESPLNVLGDEQFEQELVRAAREGRAQHGS